MASRREDITNFLDDIATDQRLPSEVLEAEMREKREEAIPDNLPQDEAVHVAPSENPLSETAPDILNTENDNVSLKTYDETAKFAALFVPDPPEDRAAQKAEVESIGEHSVDHLTTCPPSAIPSESDPDELQIEENIIEKEAENQALGVEGGKQQEVYEGKDGHLTEGKPDGSEGVEAPFEEEQLNLDAPEIEEHVASSEGADASPVTAATDTQGIVDRAWLPPDVIEKIPDLPRGASGAAAGRDRPPVAQPIAPTANTELEFRYKTPVGLTATLLFLTAVVVFAVTVGHFLHKKEDQEEASTKALMFPEWNKSESGQLILPEDETEIDILTLDVN